MLCGCSDWYIQKLEEFIQGSTDLHTEILSIFLPITAKEQSVVPNTEKVLDYLTEKKKITMGQKLVLFFLSLPEQQN